MDRDLDRREFLGRGAAGLALLGVGGCGADAATPLFRLSLAQWSLHRHLFAQVEPKLDPLDFAATARSFGIDAIEYVNVFFQDKAKDRSYLTDLKGRA